MGRTAYGGRPAARVELTPRLADGERLERLTRAREPQAAGHREAKQVPRRHTKAGNRPRGPQPLDRLRKQLGLSSEAAASIARTHTASADETRPLDRDLAEGATERRRDPGRSRRRSTAIARTGSRPVNDRLTESRPQSRTARIHTPPHELDTVLIAGGLVRVQRRRLEELR